MFVSGLPEGKGGEMEKKVRGESQKNQKEDTKPLGQDTEDLKSGRTLDSQGKVFYEAVPAAAAAQQELELPKVNAKTADFLESIVIFFGGTAVVLLLMRAVLVIFGANGGNLLTYLLYTSSYPFVMPFGLGQGQIPVNNSNAVFESIVFIAVYFAVSYGLLKIVRALKAENNKSKD